MSHVANSTRNATRKAVMLRAAEILELEGPGMLRIGSRGRILATAVRKWDELVRELRRRAAGNWRGNPRSAANLSSYNKRKQEKENGEREAL